MIDTPQQPTLSAKTIGHFDYIENGYAYGWAFLPSQPMQRRMIEVIAEGEVVGRGAAEHFREDLRNAGLGDGKCMFRLKLSHELFDGRTHALSARDAATGSPLAGGPHELGPEIRELLHPQISRTEGLKLLIDSFRNSAYAHFASKTNSFVQAYRLASQLQETDQLVEARAAWEAINDAFGGHPLIGCKLGEVLLLQGVLEPALEAFRAAVGQDMRQHHAHIGMALALQALGRLDEAEESLQIALALQPKNSSLHARLLQLQNLSLSRRIEQLIANDQSSLAISHLKRLLLWEPENGVALSLLSDLLVPPKAHNDDLPGTGRLQEFLKAERLLAVLLDEIETILKEPNQQEHFKP